MNIAFLALGILILLAYLMLNFYVGLRSYHGLKAFMPSLPRVVFWPIFLVIAFSFILGRVFTIELSFFNTLGMYWIAVFLYLLMFYILIDLIGLLNTHFKLVPETWRHYWRSKKVYVFGLVLTIVILVFGSWSAQTIRMSQYNLEIKNKTTDISKIKAVLIADLHLDSLANTTHLEKAAHEITSLNPDIILLAGDIFENYLDLDVIDEIDGIFDALQAKHGIYAVLGNHEYYGGQDAQIIEYLEQKGIVVLVDEVTEAIDGDLYIAGRNDYGSGHMMEIGERRKSVEDILIDVDHSKPIILLDHQPQEVKEASTAGVDLMLSGHTHGGQLFPIQIFTKALFIIDRGHWQDENFNLVVTTGLGTWGPPVRTNTKSEIVIMDITFSD
ncbi:MAG: hypothetical protein APF84_11960 [Gracilibacter sp. BRH_c7a]|nr:MAG: hypothetical protein APF84_11960 [Gracilibacter sp. BRH_c7a]